MIGLLLITHDTFGEALLQCACHVLNKRPAQLLQLGVAAGDDPNDLLPLAHQLLALVDSGEGALVLTDIYSAGEDPIPGITLDALAAEVRGHVGSIELASDLHDVPAAVARLARPGDVVLTLGAGSIGGISRAILERMTTVPDDPGRH